MAIVTKDSTAGVIAGGVINIGKPLQVSNGYNFPIIRAHQIGWGNSYFNSYAFSTSEELLTYIEQGINSVGSDGTAYAYTVANSAAQYWGYSYAYTFTDNLVNNVVNPHIGDTDKHIQEGERDKWNYAYDTIKTFVGTEDIEDTLDTLKEITYWLDNNPNDAAYLTVSLAELTAYTYNVVAAQADVAYGIANGAYARANDAYEYADDAFNFAQSAYDSAYWADVKADESYTYTKEVVAPKADSAFNLATDAYTLAYDGVKGGDKAYDWAKAAYTYTHNLATVDVIPHINNSNIHVSVTDRQSWNDAAGKSHSHANKGVLDGISANDIASWDDAAGKSHIHTNKGVLDGISSNDISKWNAAAENITYFLSDTAELEGKIDTLKEIAYWLDNDLEDAAYLTVSLAGLTTYTYNVVAKQADLAYSQANDALARISTLETTIDHDVEITYSVTSSETTTGYFISSVDVVRTENTNDYTLKYTYAYVPSPKADDYWAEYAIANTFSGYFGKSQKINFVDVYGEATAYSVNITNSEVNTLSHIFTIEANNVEATTYFYFEVNGTRIDAGRTIGNVIQVYPYEYDGSSYSRIEGSIISNSFTDASLKIDLYDAGTNKILTSMAVEINVVSDPT